MWWKHNQPVDNKPNYIKRVELPTAGMTQEQLKAQEKLKKQRAKDEAELRKQGYTDELIATILPVIENDK
jgi:hypothetical protein